MKHSVILVAVMAAVAMTLVIAGVMGLVHPAQAQRSADSTLSGLTLSAGTLSPAFASSTYRYSAFVGNSVPTVDVTATDPGATLTIDGSAATSGTATMVSLSEGQNTIAIVATSQDGTTTQTYTVGMYRGSAADYAWNVDDDIVLHSDNSNSRGIWSDGSTMWVADWEDEELYSYNMPDSATPPGAPTIGAVTAATGTLAISWTAPSSDGGSANIAYDLRHIETSADETVDSNWTVVDDVWATGGGTLQYTLTGLTGGTPYDLQVRAVNAGGDGPWSATATGTPTTAATCVAGGAVTNATNTGLVSDCEALLTARDTLTGSGRSLNWAVDTSIEDWEGVTVAGSPERVTELSLATPVIGHDDLTGTIPGELGNLSSLTTLDLRSNDLTGSIPSELGSLSSLTELHLNSNVGGNWFTGTIPSELGNLSNLTSLDLSGNDLTGTIPAELGNLSNLQGLGFRGNRLTGTIPTELANLTNLQQLDLSYNELTAEIPSSFTRLTNQSEFLFNDNAGLCAPRDSVFQAWLQSIASVEGDNCPLADSQADQDVLVALYNTTDGVNWSDNSNWLSDRPMRDWYGVSINPEGRVSGLKLSYNDLSGSIPTQLANLSNLEQLDLYSNKLTGSIPSELADLSNLKYLNLYGNGLTGTIPSQLGNLSNLTYLNLYGNDLTGTIPSQLGNLSNLGRLDLGGNELTGTIPSQLGNLSNLGRLDLGGNELTGTIPSQLGNPSKLDWLDLSSNDLSGTIPTQLGSLSRLRVLYLWDNQLSGEIPSELGSLSKLTTLYLNDNQLTGELPTSFMGLTSLGVLIFDRNAGLCAPIDNAFQTWLQSVRAVHGSCCALTDSQQDKDVLTKFYNSTDGASWGNNSNWLSNRPLREWYGITNDADGRVTGLYLWENQLSGSIPPELGNLSSLEWLYLHNNQLTGTIPDELGSLVNLRGLFLNGNQVTGCIPDVLRDVELNDLDRLGLDFCTPQSPGAPSVSVTTTGAALVRLGTAIPITATFSEPVNGFTESDVTVSNGDISNFSGSDGDSAYTFDVTPNAIGVVTVDIPSGAATDSDGEANTAAEQLALGLPYDDDHDGLISASEVLRAVADYFNDRLSAGHVLQIVALFFASSN